MTQNEKDKIKQMRLSGFSYGVIAEKLNLSENTISSFCRREKISVQSEPAICCKECGKPLKITTSKKSRTFCSDSCRYVWWNKHRALKPGNSSCITICKHCGKKFNSYGNRKRKYCSHTCYITDRFQKGADANE